MNTQLQNALFKSLLVIFILLLVENVQAQCIDNFTRPSDGFQVEGWSPRCHNGNDGEIRITGISTTRGQNDFTNQNFHVRIISGPGSATTFPIPSNSSAFTINGLTAGTYIFDIVDQCGGNSADKTVTLVNPPQNSTLPAAVHIFKDITKSHDFNGCGNILKYRITLVSTDTGGDIVCVFTNHTGNTFTYTKPVTRLAQPTNKTINLDIEIPTAFFNGNSITYSLSNSCGLIQESIVPQPTVSNIVYGIPSIIDTSDPENACFIGYDIKVFRDFMTNPITVTVEEAANPGITPLDFLGNPIAPKVVNMLHLNSVAMGMANPIALGLKYNTHYNITFVDACGITVTKPMVQTITPFNPSLSCATSNSITDPSGFFDDTALLVYNGVAISSNAVGPVTLTVNSGPASYTTTSGSGNVVTSASIQYPYSITIISPFLNDFIFNDNIRSFPTGLYNITATDACGKTRTFSQSINCSRNFTISHSLQTCGNISDNSIGIKMNIPKGLYGTRATVYKADGSIVLTGIITGGSPFHYTDSPSLGTLTFNLPNNTEYYFRYGGVSETGTVTEPIQFGGVGALPRLQDGYLYEYYFKTELTPFRFEAIQACGTSVTMVATGGTAPYTFTVLDQSGNVQLFPHQNTASFNNLTTGITYTAKAIDACGREFTQQFEVFPLPIATIESITQSACQNNTGSVTLSNLPSDWTITANPGNFEFSGTTPSFTINNIQPGTSTFMVQDNITLCSANQMLQATINATPICPIASDDSTQYESGQAVTINVVQNDTTGALVNPVSVSLVPQANNTNIVTVNGSIISMVIAGEGTWTVNPTTGHITFEPFPSFLGSPSAIQYNIKDFNGNISNNAFVTTDLLPIVVDDFSNYTPGIPITIPITINDNLGDHINPETITLVLPESPESDTPGNTAPLMELSVPEEGTWSINTVSETATFTPLQGFTGLPTAQKYRVRDYQGNPSNIAIIQLELKCSFLVTCPNFPVMTVACYDEIPTATHLTKTEFEKLGDANGSIGNSTCGIVEITAFNSPYSGCNTLVERTYTITEFQDDNANRMRDLGENTILNIVTCNQTFQVNDTIPPTYNETLPVNLTVECNAVPMATTLTARDNCRTATVSFNETITAEDCANSYSIVRTWQATDICGNSNTHTQTITVTDTTAPVFNEILPKNLTLESTQVIPPSATLSASDNCSDATVTFEETTQNGSCMGITVITRTWKAVDACGNENIHVQTITRVDTTPPVFTSSLPQNQTLACGNIPPAAILTATDNLGEVTITFEEIEVEGDCKSKSSVIRTWTATDSCGNMAIHSQTLFLNCQVKVYNAVSPNGDGSNDIFYLEGIECFPNNSVQIFNRWGAKVYETQGYDNTTNVFRGVSEGKNTISKNEALPTGTYFYILHYDFNANGNPSEKIEKSGYLYVVNN